MKTQFLNGTFFGDSSDDTSQIIVKKNILPI